MADENRPTPFALGKKNGEVYFLILKAYRVILECLSL